MQDDKVADTFVFKISLSIKFINVGLNETAVGQEAYEAVNRGLDEVDAGGLQWL